METLDERLAGILTPGRDIAEEQPPQDMPVALHAPIAQPLRETGLL
jgi:hypothetical protein